MLTDGKVYKFALEIGKAMMQQLVKRKIEKPSVEEVERLLAEIQKEPELLKKAKEFAANIGRKA